MKEVLEKSWLGLLSLFVALLGLMGCKERVEDVVSPSVGGELVTVSLNLGFADYNGDDLSRSGSPLRLAAPARRSGSPLRLAAPARVESSSAAFNASPISEVSTRSSDVIPDKLYNLEIRQYEANGDCISGKGQDCKTVDVGKSLDVTLAERADCQLVLVAHGSGTVNNALSSKSISGVQDIMINRSVIETIDPTIVGNMNKMPYVLYLKHVKVTSDGRLQSPDIESADGPQDVRLLLKRLAARVTVKWNYDVAVGGDHYTLKQLLLQDVPLNFNYVPKPDADGVYPDIVDQYTTLEVFDYDVSAHQTEGTYSFWVPANVRKDNPAVTSDLLRIKANASVGSSYLTFVAVNDKDAKKKFNYRIYLGNDDPANFSIKSNTDYIYAVNFNHTSIPASDRRVTYIDPIPASENNDNLVPTANCFMVAPGGAFCFDPFVYRQNGTDIVNPTLKGWSDSEGGIVSVELLWQTKENGDVGEPVMGIANSVTNHTNIVDIKRNDGLDIVLNPLKAVGDGRIYCRVAVGTTGGSGLIVARNKNTGEIIWSWHVWVTTYNPDPIGNVTVLDDSNKRKQKYVGNGAPDQLPMMDRNLGAMQGYVELPSDPVDWSRACGFHYQGGRKDPFPSSYTIKTIYSVTFQEGDRTPPIGMLNQFEADGISYYSHRGKGNGVSYRDAYKIPSTLTGAVSGATWNSSVKNEHDPCPAGWRVPSYINFRALFADGTNTYWSASNTPIALYRPKGMTGDITTYLNNGKGNGYLLYYDDNNNATYFRMTGYPPAYNDFRYIGTNGNIWTRESKKGFTFGTNVTNRNAPSFCIGDSWGMADAHSVRCIQEKGD